MYEHSMFRTGPRRDPNLRAGDADREAIAERLRRSHADGRLDMQEFQDRIDRCYQATTIGELEQLVADLPVEQQPERRIHAFRLAVVPLVPILIGLLLVSAVVGHHGFGGLWIVLPLFFLVKFWRRRRWSGAVTRGGHDSERAV